MGNCQFVARRGKIDNISFVHGCRIPRLCGQENIPQENLWHLQMILCSLILRFPECLISTRPEGPDHHNQGGAIKAVFTGPSSNVSTQEQRYDFEYRYILQNVNSLLSLGYFSAGWKYAIVVPHENRSR